MQRKIVSMEEKSPWSGSFLESKSVKDEFISILVLGRVHFYGRKDYFCPQGVSRQARHKIYVYVRIPVR